MAELVVTPPLPSALSSATSGCGRFRTRSFSPRCLARSPARWAPNTASSSWSIRCRAAPMPRCGRRFCLLGSLIAADNLLWRVAAWIANYAFVGVTGDLRRDLFRHLTGHSPSYFADRLPGMLTSRVTATSNAVFTAENMFVWNVLPPMRGDAGGDRSGLHHQPADGGRARRRRRHHGLPDVPARRRRPAAASRLRQQGGGGRRRNGRRRQQYAAGAGVRRIFARASPLRRHRRSRDQRAAAQPVLSGKAAHLPCRGDDHADARPAGLGDHAVDARARRRPATSCSPARSRSRC